MVRCVICGCNSFSGRDKVSFYAIPSIPRDQCDKTLELSSGRQALWVTRINRPDFGLKDITANPRVCAKHFVNGEYILIIWINLVLKVISLCTLIQRLFTVVLADITCKLDYFYEEINHLRVVILIISFECCFRPSCISFRHK